MKKYIALESPQASTCNLDCVYCYIPKNKVLSNIHKKWSARIRNGEYLEILSENYEEIEAMSLWGGEPSLGFKDFTKLKDTFVKYPQLKNLSTSTNFSNFSPHEFLLINLQKIAVELNREISLDLQISIDGDEEQTDHNRGKGVYKKIIENIKKLYDLSFKIPNVNIAIHTKATNVDEDYQKFADDPSYLERYLDSFTFLETTYVEKLDWPNNVHISLFGLPTLALPGSYTKEDGEKFYKYHTILDSLKKTKYKGILQTEDMYYGRFYEMLKNSFYLNYNSFNETSTCSAGVTMIGVDGDGTVHGCHGSFWYNYKEYLESSNDLSDWTEGRRILDFSADKFWNLTKPIISNYRDEYNKKRLQYNLSAYANNVKLKSEIAYTTIKMLVNAGQLNEIYHNENWAKLYAYFIALKSTCWVNSQYMHGSLYVNSLSIYRMYGNGAFEYNVKKYWSKNDISKLNL